jgi:hypothetical protein
MTPPDLQWFPVCVSIGEEAWYLDVNFPVSRKIPGEDPNGFPKCWIYQSEKKKHRFTSHKIKYKTI